MLPLCLFSGMTIWYWVTNYMPSLGEDCFSCSPRLKEKQRKLNYRLCPHSLFTWSPEPLFSAPPSLPSPQMMCILTKVPAESLSALRAGAE